MSLFFPFIYPTKHIVSFYRIVSCLLLCLCFLLLPWQVQAIDTVQNGNWSNPATWQGGAVPAPGSNIRILHQVVLNIDANVNQLEITVGSQLEVSLFSITVQGDFILSGRFVDGADLGTNIFEGNINVSSSGEFVPVANSDYIFRGNITNEGIFNHSGTGTIAFSGTTPQQILPLQSITLEGNLLNIQNNLEVRNGEIVNFNSTQIQINTGTTLLNQNTTGLILTGALLGTGTFENAQDARVLYEASDVPTVSLLTSANNNTFTYRSNQNQNIKASTYFHLEVGNTALTPRQKALSGAASILGNLTLLEGLQGNTIFNPQAHNLTVSGQTLIQNKAQLDDNDAQGTATFEGQVSIAVGGQFSPASASNFVFRGGILNEGIFEILNGGSVLFEGNNQSIQPLAPILIQAPIEVAQTLTLQNGSTIEWQQTVLLREGATLTNQNTALVLGNTLNALSNNALLINAQNAIIFYRGEASPLTTGQADLTAQGNQFVYDRNGAQAIGALTYGTLRLAGTGVKTLTGTTTVLNNLLITSILEGGNQGLILRLEGDFDNQGQFLAGDSKVIFQGNQPQTVQQNTGTLRFYDIEIDKTAGTVSNASPLEIVNNARFVEGFWESSNANPLIFLENATTQGASSQSFVRGLVQKTGSQPFTFPIGEGAVFAPLRIFNLNQGDTFSANYTHTAHPQAGISNPDFTFISQVEYWTLAKQNTATSYQIALFWTDGIVSGIQQPSDLTLIHWDTSLWQDYPSEAQGSTNAGQLQSREVLIVQGDFTFASLEAFNSLGNTDLVPPSPLLESVVATEAGHIALTWQDLAFQETAYQVERSTEESPSFVAYQTLPRNSTTFTDTEVQLGQTYFYRLVAQNNFGISAPSNVLGALVGTVSNLEDTPEVATQIYPNPSTGRFIIQKALLPLEVMDSQGKTIPFSLEEVSEDVLLLDLSQAASGMYWLKMGVEKPLIKKIIKY